MSKKSKVVRPTKKICKSCLLSKSISNFYRGRATCKACRELYLTKHRLANADKINARKRKWKTNNPDKVKSASLMSDYGINLTQYNEMLIKQNHGCAICLTHKSKFKNALHVDHNHVTGKIRGLLCLSCNRALGLLKDDKKLFLSAANYLETTDGK